MKEISWYVEDGCMGGQRGLSFDLETNTITNWNGIQENLNSNNFKDVMWIIDNNINELNDRISKLKNKINQTDSKRIPIKDGHIISNPLTDKQKSKKMEQLNDLTSELDWYILTSKLIWYKSTYLKH